MTEATFIHDRTRRMLEAVIAGEPVPVPFELRFASNPTSGPVISPALTSRFHL